MSDSHSFSILKASTDGDFQRMRRLCCETADAGRPIPEPRWGFWGEWWIGPYQEWRKDWCWVASAGGNGAIIGYLTASPETFFFEARCALRFRPRTLCRFLSDDFKDFKNSDARRMLRRAFFLERSPFRRFPFFTRMRVLREYPAHLHVNVDAAWRNKGVGRALHEACEAQLRCRGVRGMHLLCGPKPVGYYEKMGFSVHAIAVGAAGNKIHLLVKKFPAFTPP